MLRTDIYAMAILLLAALATNNLPPYIANILAFIAGLCLKTIPEIISGSITIKDLLRRMSFIFGLVIIGYLIWIDKQIKTQMFYYTFVVTFCSEIIVALFAKYITKWLNREAKKLDNE